MIKRISLVPLKIVYKMRQMIWAVFERIGLWNYSMLLFHSSCLKTSVKCNHHVIVAFEHIFKQCVS